jgi:GNAT superfamily N-acetyltransferase
VNEQGSRPLGDQETVRLAGSEDLPGIMRLQLASYEASLREPASLFEEIIRASPDSCFASEHEGAMDGYLLTHPIPHGFVNFGGGPPPLSGFETELYLHDMCVSPSYRNRGVGRRLFEALNAYLESERFTKITAVAVQDSEKFWQKCGFEIGVSYSYPGGAHGYVITRFISENRQS